jgi:DNA-binding IscR family transcriptional regulator
VQRGVPAFALAPQSPEFPRLLALLAMIRLAENQDGGGVAVSYESLAAEMRSGLDTIEPILDRLKQAGLIVENLEGENALARRIYLCRAPAAITVEEILEPVATVDAIGISDLRIRKVLEIVAQASRDAVRPITLADLVKGGNPKQHEHG